MADYGEAVEQTIPGALVALIETAYGYHIRSASAVAPNDEAVAWRGVAERALFIHQSPSWRTRDELTWVHRLVTKVAPLLPEAIAPLQTKTATTFVEYGDAFVTLYPFVEGVHLDREDARQRDTAARFLARVHQALLRCEMPPRPEARPHSSWRAVLAQAMATQSDARSPSRVLLAAPEAAELVDNELDAWHGALVRRSDLRRGLVHGDYYRRNVLWADDRVAALVDWHEAHHDLLVAEVAQATWEFSKGSDSRSFNRERARAFLDAYAEAGGPGRPHDRALVIPLIRWRLREEALLSLALEARQVPVDTSYREAVTASFRSLRGRAL